MTKIKIKIFLLIILITVPMSFLNYNIVISRSDRQIREDLPVAKEDQPKQAVSVKWTPNGKPICTEVNNQENIDIFSDGANGAGIVWEDNRTGERDIYGQHVNTSGKIYGDNNGIIICNATNDQFTPKGVANITTGVIIVWADNRTDELDIYAQRIDTNGNLVWGDNGTAICNATGEQLDPQICGDGLGGAIIAWEDERDDTGDIYVQRIDPDGNLLWGNNGTGICNGTSQQRFPQIISDNSTGAIVTWQDNRTWEPTREDIYALRINKDGNKVAGWVDNGTIISNVSQSSEYEPQLCLYNSGGAFITWRDTRGMGIGSGIDIYAQLVDPDGTTLWKGNGTVICNATEVQTEYYIIQSDSNSAIISWEDWRNFPITGFSEIYAQKINFTGKTLWDDNGTVICNADNKDTFPRICSDGYGGAVITWWDWRNSLTSGFDIYAQRINSNGVSLWGNNGKFVCKSSSNQKYPELCSNGEGGAIIAWEDQRNIGSTGYDIYAQSVIGGRSTGLIPGAADDDDDDDEGIILVPIIIAVSIVAIVGVIVVTVIYLRKRKR